MKQAQSSTFVRRLLLAAFLLIVPAMSLNAGEAVALQQQKVYVVMSNTAYAYHSNRNCKGLKKATHTIKEITLEEAREMGRKPCKICYGNKESSLFEQ